MKDFFRKYIKYLIFAVLIYSPIFGHLDTLPIRIWDEARLAMNAYEMLKDGDYLVTHFDGKPDMWNTKPPLFIWCQVLLMKIIGVNELSVRLPSAVAAFFTCLVILAFSLKYFKNFWFGFIAVFILITSQGYINLHATRTGDYDAMLTLFTTLSGLLFFSYCETQNIKHLYLFFLFITLSVLTKSISGLLFLPAIIIYAISQKQLIPLLKNKHFYIGIFSCLVTIITYYILREINNPGYIEAVWKNELGGRYFNVIEGHERDIWFYYDNLINFQLSYWYPMIPCGLITGITLKDKFINRLTLFLFLMIVVYFLVISIAQTKLKWYDVPLYPYLSILIAIFIFYIFDYLQKNSWFNQSLSVNIIPFIFLFIIGIEPYQKIIDKTYKPKEYGWDKDLYEISYFLKNAVNGKNNLNYHYLVYEGYNAHLLFYIKILNDKGIKFSFKDWSKLLPNDTVIVSQNHLKEFIEKNYDFKLINTHGNLLIYKIYGVKK